VKCGVCLTEALKLQGRWERKEKGEAENKNKNKQKAKTKLT